VGLCHGVTNTACQIAEVLGVPFAELDYTAAGINHQTWFLSLKHKGKELRHKLLKAFENHPVYNKQEKVRIDILRRFGYFCTESNGHVAEYVPWYRKSPREIRKWIDMSDWILGETGGYLRVCIEGRNWFETDFPNWLKEPAPVISLENRSLEHGGRIVEAIETGRVYRGHFNVVNHGRISNLPDDCVVEIPGYVDRTGINACSVGELPLACAATCNASVQVQRMAVRAAVQGDVTLLKQAMLHDPLVGAVCNPPEIWQLTDEMLVEEAEWLPQYKREIPRAIKRLAEEKTLGTRTVRGAARKKTKTISEMKRNVKAARRLAGAVDKAAKP
jgi:alpha-galactosidase